MIVTAAQAIMRHTLAMKMRWRNLSLNEHSGNLQLEICKGTQNNIALGRNALFVYLPQTSCGANTDIGTARSMEARCVYGRTPQAISERQT